MNLNFIESQIRYAANKKQIEIFHNAIQGIYRLIPGDKPYMISRDLWDTYWSCAFNPEKNETPHSESTKWINHLVFNYPDLHIQMLDNGVLFSYKMMPETVSTHNCGVEISYKRGSGNTTRLIDWAIAQLYTGKGVYLVDHIDRGLDPITNRYIFDRLRNRLISEHNVHVRLIKTLDKNNIHLVILIK